MARTVTMAFVVCWDISTLHNVCLIEFYYIRKRLNEIKMVGILAERFKGPAAEITYEKGTASSFFT